MKLNITGITTKVTLFATALLATCLFAGAAHAQTVHGKFTLDHSARWGKAVLPAGEYNLTIDPSSLPSRAVVTDAKSGRKIASVLSAISEDAPKGDSALLIGQRGNQRVIYSFRLAEVGQVFIYDPALAHGRGVLEANNTETVPVLDAKK
jgi:hypothetical protein